MATYVKKPNGKVLAKVRHRGQKVSRVFLNEKEAQTWARRIETNIDQGKAVEAGDHKFKDLVDYFSKTELLDPERYKESSHEKLTTFWAWWAKKLGAETQLTEITRERIGEAIKGLRTGDSSRSGRPLAGNTINRHIDALSVLLDYAQKKLYWIDDNPIKKVAKEKPGSRRLRWLNEDEQKALLKAALETPTDPEGRLWLWVKTGLTSGARLGEIEQLTWRDFDFDEGTITIRGTASEMAWDGDEDGGSTGTKNRETRIVLLHPEVAAALRKIQKQDVVPTHPFGIFPVNSYKKAVKNSGVRHGKGRPGRIVFHTLRHTCATMLAKNGASAHDLQEYMGWKSRSMADRYVHKTAHLNPRMREIVTVLL